MPGSNWRESRPLPLMAAFAHASSLYWRLQEPIGAAVNRGRQLIGAGGALDTKTMKDPVVGFVFGQKGLMANLTLEGSKYEKFTPQK